MKEPDMPNFRKNRVADLIREVISDIIKDDLKDPRVQGITITEVKMSSDLKTARIFFCSLTDGKTDLHLAGLQSAEGFIRKRLRDELDLKYVPQIIFEYDSSFDYSDRINSILNKIRIAGDDDNV
jgi:ribosome-binding factor A